MAKFLTEEEADQAFKALCPGGEIEYQQWYHMPDKKKTLGCIALQAVVTVVACNCT